jgi:enoyl-CoA hydratase
MSAVEVRRDGGVWTIVLNRPERRNAINAQLQVELIAALRDFDAAANARVAVLTGADPAFCAGMDLRELGSGALGFTQPGPPFTAVLRAVGKPVIGAVTGATVAGGLELALGCDFLIASERAWFADQHAAVNVVPGGGLTVYLAQAVGVRRARQISLTGEYVPAERALRDGLITEVVAHEALLPRAAEIAAAVAAHDPGVVAQLQAGYERAVNLPADAALDAEWAASQAAGIPTDHVRGVADQLVQRGSNRTGAPS